MGKQPQKKNQTPKNRVRSVFGGSYVVKGRKFDVLDANSATIAADMVRRGYRKGAVASWNGGKYELDRSELSGDFSLTRLA